MICVSIAENGFRNCLKALRGVHFAEIRMDKTSLTQKEIEKIFSLQKKLIATCRPPIDEKTRVHLLEKAIDFGASFVDIELNSSKKFKQKILKKAKTKRCKVIVSFHDFKKTPSRKTLLQTIKRCFNSGADIAKIACKVNSPKDNARLLGLLESEKKLVVVGLGKKGKITRIVSPLAGGEFSFASLSKGKETADGQIAFLEMKKIQEALKNA